jgi:hypothetical protein
LKLLKFFYKNYYERKGIIYTFFAYECKRNIF